MVCHKLTLLSVIFSHFMQQDMAYKKIHTIIFSDYFPVVLWIKETVTSFQSPGTSHYTDISKMKERSLTMKSAHSLNSDASHPFHGLSYVQFTYTIPN